MVITRITPDNNDIVVWKLDDAGPTFVNSSTSPSSPGSAADLTLNTGASVITQIPTVFGTSLKGLYFYGTQAGTPRNFISGGNTFQPAYPITISGWIYLRTWSTSFTQHWIARQHTASFWSNPYWSIAITNNVSGGETAGQWYGHVRYASTYASANSTAAYPVPVHQWCHIGLTYDGTTVTTYLNGNLVATATVTSPPQAISYGNGPWFLGAIPGGSGSPEECVAALCDVRIANVVRPVSYFKQIYQINDGYTTNISLTSSQSLQKSYKLRAYDSICNEPVYWNSTSVSLLDAPASPCGGSLSNPEIVSSFPYLQDLISEDLDGIQWIIPCVSSASATACNVSSTTLTSYSSFGGDPAITYQVTLRFRGVVEQKTYTGGSNNGAYFQTGGTPAVDNWNVYSLTVNNPQQTYYLNRGTSGQSRCYGIDYQVTIPINGGATLTLVANPIDAQQIKNNADGAGGSPISVSGITNIPQPFDGQFIQMDVISVVG